MDVKGWEVFGMKYLLMCVSPRTTTGYGMVAHNLMKGFLKLFWEVIQKKYYLINYQKLCQNYGLYVVDTVFELPMFFL